MMQGAKRGFLFVGLFLAVEHSLIAQMNQNFLDGSPAYISSSGRRHRFTSERCKPTHGPYAARFFGEIVQDIWRLHTNLFSWDTFKIATSVFPLFIASRMADEGIQKCFYDRRYHKNINQMPEWCHDIAEWSIGLPIVFFGLQAFFAKDVDLRLTSRMFVLGMPFVIWTKDLIKHLNFNVCLRPWNEKFSREKRSLGGFPSGHAAEATYTAVLYGMRFGRQYALPLGCLALGVGATFLSCNRHYLSQLVAGAGFGAAYAVAASKVIDGRLSERLLLGLSMDKYGGPAFSISYHF